MYSMVQKNPNTDFILKATYPHCGKLCFTFGPNFGRLGTKRKVGRRENSFFLFLSLVEILTVSLGHKT
jgi:hypothetical protein